MSQGINVTPAEVRSSAARIATTNRALEETLNQIRKDVNALTSTWQSKAGSTTQQVFNSHASKFPEYRAYIDNYVDFLNKAAAAYEEAEKANEAGAGGFGA